jgi:hypothetical protein
MCRRLGTTRGIAAAIFTAFVVISGGHGSREPVVALIALLIISPVIWWFCWWTLVVLYEISGFVRGGPPDVRVGRQCNYSVRAATRRREADSRGEG